MGGGVRIARPNYPKIISENRSLNGQKKLDDNSKIGLPKKRVFISFHMNNESQIKLLRHQARSEKFNLEFTDYSVKQPFDKNWKARCEERIRQSSVVVCMIGSETYKRPAVLWELNKAYEMGKRVIGVKIHKNRKDPIPGPLRRNKAEIVNWDLKDLQRKLDED